ncbi:N-acetylneuraminate synthase family protein [Thermodesulfobacteriota bacterium]
MKIADFDTDKNVLVIAEIGNNHEGSYELAEEMIGRAAEAGANAVKFQTIIPERLISISQTERINQLRSFQLSQFEFERLSRVAKNENVLFLSTPFDIESVSFLDPLVPAFKIASGDNTFFPLLETVAATNKPIILSTGMTSISRIRQSRDLVRRIWKEVGVDQDIALLHCVGSYPTPLKEANLSAIIQLKEMGETVGYSDHTLGIDAAVLSVALGARIIEKHFTLDHNFSKFRDHQLSADPEEFALLNTRIQEAIYMMGDGKKEILECEKENSQLLSRSIVAKGSLPKGTRLEREHLNWVRPGGGLAPGKEDQIIGKVLKRQVNEGEMLGLEDVE